MQQIINKRPAPLNLGKRGVKYTPLINDQDSMSLYIINSADTLDVIAEELTSTLSTEFTKDNLKIFWKEGDDGTLIDKAKVLVMLSDSEFKQLLNKKYRIDKFYIKPLPPMKNTTVFFRLEASSCDIKVIDERLTNLFRGKAPTYKSHLPVNEDKTHKGFGFLSFDAPYSQTYFAKALLNNEMINSHVVHTSWNKKQTRDRKKELTMENVKILTK